MEEIPDKKVVYLAAEKLVRRDAVIREISDFIVGQFPMYAAYAGLNNFEDLSVKVIEQDDETASLQVTAKIGNKNDVSLDKEQLDFLVGCINEEIEQNPLNYRAKIEGDGVVKGFSIKIERARRDR